MKKLYLILMGGIVSIGSLNAQEKPNLVKVNLLPLTTGTFAVEYERALTSRLTAVGMFSYRPEGTLPLASIWERYIDDEDTKEILGDTRQGATSYALEARFYTGRKGAFRGFYLAPYVKQATYALNVPLNLEDYDQSQTGVEEFKQIDAQGNLRAFSAGFGLGFQFKIGNSLALDWRLIGPGYGSSKGTLTAKADRDLTPDEQQEVREQLDNLGDIPFVTVESKTVDTKGAELKIKGPWAGIRTGLSIGYRF